MTIREAFIHAHQELGFTEEEIRLKIKAGIAGVPDVLQFLDCPVKAGLERAFIQELKQIFRVMDAHPDLVREGLRIRMAKRLQAN